VDGDGTPDIDDCRPWDASVHPGATDLPNGLDDDCDGAIDQRPAAPGDLVITEIMINPNDVDDDFGRWFEVTNVGTSAVVLDGLTVDNGEDPAFTVTAAAALAPGDTLLFAGSADPAQNGGITPDFVWDPDVFRLHRHGGITLTLGGATLDAVRWDDTFPDVDGASMSLDPGSATPDGNDAGTAWCAGTTPYGDNLGTPDAPNPECP
jgi:hypothetical protein